MAATRTYELKERAKRQEETRRRITEVTVELHRTVGPARTQISEIARRAGVQRLTVYKHFPDQTELFQACSAHWRAEHPPPDPRTWSEVEDPRLRAEAALKAIYDYFSETESMLGNVLHDSETMPALRKAVEGGFLPYVAGVRDVITGGWRLRGRRRERLAAIVELALQFRTWRHLTRERGLTNGEAAALMLDVIVCAAG